MKDETDKALKDIAKGAGFAFAGIMISKVLGYSYRLIIARLGPEDYGILSIALAIFNFLGIIAVLGMPQAIQRYVSFYKERKQESKILGIVRYCLRLTFSFGVIIALILFILSDWIAVSIFHEQKLSLLIKIIAVIIPLDGIRSIFINLCKAYKYLLPEIYIRNIGENFIKVVFTIIFLSLGLGLLGATLAYAVAVIFTVILSYIFVKKVYKFRSEKQPEYERRVWLHYSIPLLINHFLLLILLWMDTFMLGIFRSSGEVGIYNAASPTAQLIYVFPLALLSLFLPVLSSLYSKNDTKALHSCYASVTKWIFVVNLYSLIVLTYFAREILTLLFGKIYETGFIVLIILVSGYFIYHLSLPANNILMIIEKTRLVFIISLIGATLNIILNYLLIPKYGILGAGIATGLSVLIMGIMNFIFVYKILHLNPIRKSYIKSIIACLIVLGLFMLSNKIGNNNIIMIITIISGFLVYGLILLALKVLDKEDLIILNYMEKGVFNKITKILKKLI
ncbi:flippase [Candidatus Woesearchaeota archaeon]|nr:MAG: polysaccharide biosynthesis related protein [archaeon GW2011_AR18]MBS3162151.1 flippase [Candidatus Woesearchaeota archaeon]HIH26255.1 flippase [Nanoarchaeota archaeon]